MKLIAIIVFILIGVAVVDKLDVISSTISSLTAHSEHCTHEH